MNISILFSIQHQATSIQYRFVSPRYLIVTELSENNLYTIEVT